MSAAEVKFDHPYVDYHHGGYWVAGTRVSLDSIVYRWREGLSAETIQSECFETLDLSQVFGALAYYLDHLDEIDEYLTKGEKEETVIAQQLREQYPKIHRKLDEILQNTPAVAK